MSIMHQSQNLTNHSLQSFINEVTQSNMAEQIHHLAFHPKIDTISDAHKNLLNLFLFSTYKQYKANKKLSAKLNEKQIYQLKRVTIFDLFQGKNEVPISYLLEELELSTMQLYRLLTQMNTSGVISIKINEKQGICYIYSAPSRLKQNYDKLAPSYNQRLQSIIAKNSDYLSCLKLAKGTEKKKRSYLDEY